MRVTRTKKSCGTLSSLCYLAVTRKYTEMRHKQAVYWMDEESLHSTVPSPSLPSPLSYYCFLPSNHILSPLSPSERSVPQLDLSPEGRGRILSLLILLPLAFLPSSLRTTTLEETRRDPPWEKEIRLIVVDRVIDCRRGGHSPSLSSLPLLISLSLPLIRDNCCGDHHLSHTYSRERERRRHGRRRIARLSEKEEGKGERRGEGTIEEEGDWRTNWGG